jgi:hypothetical protein
MQGAGPREQHRDHQGRKVRCTNDADGARPVEVNNGESGRPYDHTTVTDPFLPIRESDARHWQHR